MKTDNRRNLTSQMAYLAGFFDGEGCIRLKKSYRPQANNFYLTVQVSNSDRLVLEDFKTMFAGSVTKRGRSKNFDIYMWECHTANAADFLRAMQGFLRTKRPQAIYALSVHDNLPAMTYEQRLEAHDKLSAMKLEVIGNIYENRELLETTNDI